MPGYNWGNDCFGHGGMGWFGGGGWPYGFLSVLVPLLFLVLVGAVIWLVVRSRRPVVAAVGPGTAAPAPGATATSPATPPAPRPASDALAILQERYARGEIDREEFLARRDDLT